MSASDPTVAELLTKVNVAIYELLTRKVKSWTLGTTTYTYQNLDELRLLRSELKKEVDAGSSSSRRSILLADISGRPS
ncbi:hypothetical protein LCGC14_2559870 [marine sediment metagenome]|uniref:Uncharacterized protein n=1 Tax=marine sediment metagenome TaxID=412755 RepID=A0A0F9B885_9ZZZZ